MVVCQYGCWKNDLKPALAKSGIRLLNVDELDQAKLRPLLLLKYHDSITDAVADLGKPEEIGKVFSGFQRYLYEEKV